MGVSAVVNDALALVHLADERRRGKRRIVKLGEIPKRGRHVGISDKAALQIIKVLNKKNPKPRYIIADNKLTTFLPTIIPTRLFDKIVSQLFKMDYGE